MVEAVDEAGMVGRYGLSSAALTVIFALGYTVGPLVGAASSAVLPFLATYLLAAAVTVAATAWAARALPGTKPGPRLCPWAKGPRALPLVAWSCRSGSCPASPRRRSSAMTGILRVVFCS